MDEALMKDALTAIQKRDATIAAQARRIQHLEACVKEAGATISEYEQLAKARGENPASFASTVTKALRTPQPGAQSAWHLLPSLVAAQKARFAHESLSQEERIERPGFAPQGATEMTALAAERTSTQVAADLEALDAWEAEHSTPARKGKRARLEKELQEVCYREVSEAKAIEEASRGYVQELEAAYDEAFQAMEAITKAIERVHKLRSRERV